MQKNKRDYMRLYAVREWVLYDSDSIVALFTTQEKAIDYVKRKEAESLGKLLIEQVLVDTDEMIV